jgi:hypothetical protein
MGVAPDQPVRIGNQDQIDLTAGHSITQAVECRPVEARPTVAIILIDPLGW